MGCTSSTDGGEPKGTKNRNNGM